MNVYQAKYSHCFNRRPFLGLITLILLFMTSGILYAAEPTIATRVESKFGNSDFYFSTGEWREKRNPEWTNLRSGERKIAANFLVEEDNLPVTIYFSAEAFVDTREKSLALRLLVDGKPMAPADVILARGKKKQIAAQSFEFTGNYSKGMHTVEAQVYADRRSAGKLRQVGLFVRQGDQPRQGSHFGITPESGKNIETRGREWSSIPGLVGSIKTEVNECLTATISAEAYASQSTGHWLRVLTDGDVAEPGEVEFVHGSGYEGTRTMVFGTCDLAAGEHQVEAQWHAENNGVAGMGDRTLTLATLPNGQLSSLRQYFNAANDSITATNSYEAIKGLNQTLLINPNSEISVLLSAEFPDTISDNVYARLAIQGQPIPDSEVLLANENTNPGVHSFIFNAKHWIADSNASFGDIEIEWRTDSGASNQIKHRSMIAYVQPQAIPDFAVPAPLAGVTPNARVEPMRGSHDTLVILLDIERPNHPAPTIAELDDAFFANSASVADYYREVSNHQFTLNSVGVLGPYESDENWQYYWNGPGDHQDKWVEAIEKADTDFNFAGYDHDGDGYINPWNELAIVIVIPQSNSAGFVRHLWDGSGETPKTFDGVHIEMITEWYVSNPTSNYMVAAHELGHNILMLPDLYGQSNSTAHNTGPGRLSLMDRTFLNATGHIDAGLKLPLGWVTPTMVNSSGNYTLDDVKTSRNVLVLPRLPGSKDAEYIVLENRQSEVNNFQYDMNLLDSGIAVWHIVEGTTDNDSVPFCTSNSDWNASVGNDEARQAIRLVRPSVTPLANQSLWSSEHYPLDAFGAVCSGTVNARRNVLQWSDGTPSYQIGNFSNSGPSMDVMIMFP